MRNVLATYCVIVSLLIILQLSARADQKSFVALCPGNLPPIDCIKTHFDALYEADYGRLWEVYRIYEKKAVSCKNPRDVAAFLDLADAVQMNAEVSEGFAEFIEKLILSNPKCFLEGAVLLGDRSISSLVDAFVRSPIYHDDTDIRRHLQKDTHDKRYQRFMNLYFNSDR